MGKFWGREVFENFGGLLGKMEVVFCMSKIINLTINEVSTDLKIKKTQIFL